jgi:hypothetical protein
MEEKRDPKVWKTVLILITIINNFAISNVNMYRETQLKIALQILPLKRAKMRAELSLGR